MTEEERKKAGKRLKECMKQRKLSLSGFVDLISDETGLIFSEQTISQLRTGYRRITEQNAFIFADLLGIEAGYLLGKDGFSASSYEEYLSFMDDLEKQKADLEKWKEQIRADKSHYHKYDAYLKSCGYEVIDMECTQEGRPTKYKIASSGTEKWISVKDMEKFRKAINEQIQLRMGALMDK